MGTPATTTLGMGLSQMKEIASIVVDLLKEAKPAIDEKTKGPSRAKVDVEPSVIKRARSRVADVLKDFPLYPELLIDEN